MRSLHERWAASIAVLALVACGSSSNGATQRLSMDSGDASGTSIDSGGTSTDSGDTDSGGDAVDGSMTDAGGGPALRDAGPPPPDPCIEAGSCAPGVWVDVTPSNADLADTLDCGNYGSISMQPDPMRPSDLYTQFNCQGVWKSIDYGQTWHGPINTGMGGSGANGAGGITIPRAGTTTPPVIYSAGIRGTGNGFWKSTDGGVSWTNYNIAPGGSRQDFYPPVDDPYDASHLLMAAHEQNMLVESTDGGQTWTNVAMDPGMNEQGGTGAIFFVDTGAAPAARATWLWLAQGSGGTYGTWRTSDAGKTWKQVDTNEHAHGASQIFQPDPGGVVYMAGIYSKLGWGVLRSTDYGQTWTHVGSTGSENLVFGTSKNVYAMYGWASLDPVTPSLEVAPQPGMTWAAATTPATMTHGPGQVAVVFDGMHSIVVSASWTSGLWRYIEP